MCVCVCVCVCKLESVSSRMMVCLHFIFINDMAQHIKGFGNRSNKSKRVISERMKNEMNDEREVSSLGHLISE